MLRADPAGHPSLILVAALDLGQVDGGGALHLETLLGKKDSQGNRLLMHRFDQQALRGRLAASRAIIASAATNRALFPWRRLRWPPQRERFRVLTLHHMSPLGIYLPSPLLFIITMVTVVVYKEASPGHTLVPTSFRCRTDSTASVCLEEGSCSSGRERNKLNHMNIKVKAHRY